MLRPIIAPGLLFFAWTAVAPAQNSDFGVDVPVTLSGGILHSERLQLRDPAASAEGYGFRAMFYPTLKLGPHWFGYAAVQTRYNPYFYYDTFNPQHDVETDVIQAFGGYSFNWGKALVLFKAGRLSSAFGWFPPQYDDARTPLLDQPLSYMTILPVRSDQLPCGTADLLKQSYGSVSNSCGGTPGRGPGMVPATLYGLPGAEMDVSAGRIDARAQLTTGSPANPQSFTSFGRYVQWTAGAGYTIRQGFRVGVSGFRGPYLDRAVAGLLPAGTTIRDYPGSGLGIDAQWARGRWSASGEFQQFRFASPNFVIGPSFTASYIEAKRILTSRLYVSVRAGRLSTGEVLDRMGVSDEYFAPVLQSYEFAGGFWIRRNQLLKGSYSWLRSEGSSGTRLNVFGFQYVVAIHSAAWAFH